MSVVEQTPALAAKVDRWLEENPSNLDAAGLAQALEYFGIGLIDLDRTRCLVDERVYEGALHRSHRWQRLALAYMAPRLPAPSVWHQLQEKRDA